MHYSYACFFHPEFSVSPEPPAYKEVHDFCNRVLYKVLTSGAATLATDTTSFAHACDGNMPTCTANAQRLRASGLRFRVHQGGFRAMRSVL